MVARQPARGELIARGNTSDVWRWSDATVVKVLRPEMPRHWARLEADITSAVHAAGLPVPATDGVVEVEGRPAVVMERVDGASMWTEMKASASAVPGLVEQLVDLQVEVLAAGRLDGVPDLVARLTGKIAEADQLPAAEREEARSLLGSLPAGEALCHGDMHPANLLRSPRGWVIVDWFDAAVGHPTADLARSSLLMPPASAVGSANRHLDGATAQLLEHLHEAYLGSLVRRGLFDAGSFAAWEAVLAVARMSEPVQTTDLHAVWRTWRASHGSAV
jgi:aminoglycoside phosphotransferase (APT) family kinase protein